MAIESFEQLDVWQASHALVLDIYGLTATFPAEEKFGLVSQMRRSAVSVPANIAEGFKRRGAREKSRFYNIAQGSCEELRYYLILTRDLGMARFDDYMFRRCDDISKMLHRLMAAVNP